LEDKVLYKELSYRVIGAAMTVHKELGPGFPEAIYDEAFGIALRSVQIPFEPQKEFAVAFSGIVLKKTFKPDYDVEEKIIVELKAKGEIPKEDEATLLAYLRASKRRLGILINFGRPSLEYKRLLL